MVAPFRTRAVAAVESALPGTTRPSGFGATTARPGVASTFAWWIAFYSAADEPIAGGTATLQWYGINVETDGTVTTPEIGDAVAASALVTKRITASAGIWPWPRLTAITAPVVAAKSIRVSVDDTDDGDYVITVDEETPVTYAAVGKTATEIRDALVAGFAAHPTASAAADGTIEMVVTLDTAGVDFELTLEAPNNALTQTEETPLLPVAATVRVFMAETQAAGIDVDELLADIVAALPNAAAIAAEVDVEGAIDAKLAAIAGAVAAALPDAAEIATEVGAQAACADAIDAKLTAIAAAVALEVPDADAIGDLLSPPNTGPFLSGALSGSTSYTIAAAVPGSYYVLYGFEITAVGASNIKLQWKNTGGTALGEEHTVPSTGQRVVSPGARESYKTAVGEGLVLAEPSAGATLHVTYWGEYKT